MRQLGVSGAIRFDPVTEAPLDVDLAAVTDAQPSPRAHAPALTIHIHAPWTTVASAHEGQSAHV